MENRQLFLSVFTESEKRSLLQIARRAINIAASGGEEHPRESYDGALARPGGAFVTLRENHELRGCIGFIESGLPLAETVRTAAMRAAAEDPRFRPVDPDEVNRLSIEISVLSQLRRIPGPEEIEIGTHGVVVEARGRRGLLLPQVAVEFGWDGRTFLVQAAKKARISPKTIASGEAVIYAFTATVFDEESISSLHSH